MKTKATSLENELYTEELLAPDLEIHCYGAALFFYITVSKFELKSCSFCNVFQF